MKGKREFADIVDVKAYGASLVATTLFGLSYLFLKIALAANGGRMFDLLSYRFLLGALVMLAMQLTGLVRLRFKGKDMKALALMCLLNPMLYFTLEILGVSRVASSEAGMMLSVMPVVTTILGFVFLGERITRRQAFFALLSISGIVLINLCGYVPGDSSNLGRAFLLICILAASSYSVMTRKFSQAFTAVERTAALIYSGAIFFTALAAIADLRDGSLGKYVINLGNPGVLLPVLYLGLACSVLAFFLMHYAYTHLAVARISVVSNFATVVSIVAGVVFLQESFLWYHGVGSVIILLGVIGTALIRQGRSGSPVE